MGAADAAARVAPAGPFVGRDEELSELHAALRRAVAAGRRWYWSPVRREWARAG